MISKEKKVPLRLLHTFFSDSKRFSHSSLSLWVRAGEKGKNRHLVVVPKKHISSAVKRNNLRRKIYSVLEENMASHFLNLGNDYVWVVINKSIINSSEKEIALDLQKLIQKTSFHD